MLAAAVSLALVPSLATATVASFAQKALAGSTVSAASERLASPYGVVARFGGYGEELGKFVVPVGFAVAPEEGNAVYVLDRVVNESQSEPGRLGYRLQKLSSAGTVLGSVTLPVQEYSDTEDYSDANPLVSLAVDSREKRVYAVVEGMVNTGRGDYAPVAQRLVAWSTEPDSSKELVKAAGAFSEDPLTHAALIAGESVLEHELSKDLYAPSGLAIAVDHEVVIEAQDGVTERAQGGPTVLQSVTTKAPEGELGPKWVAETGQPADGLFTTTSGSFGIDLYNGDGRISDLAEVSANLKEALPIAEDKTGGVDLDQAPSIDNASPVNYHGQYDDRDDLEPYTAGSPVTQLTNNLYAARYAQDGLGVAPDPQSEVEPWSGVPVFWFQGEPANKDVANEGIRLITSNGTVITTIGGQAQGLPCSINTAQVAVAAGSKGSVFVLTQPNEDEGNSGDEVIEFAPGGKVACPQPSGTLIVNGKSGSSFTFPVGTNVTLADSVERKGEAPYRFDWVLLNTGTLGLEDLYTQMEAPHYLWPASSTSRTFTKKGTYDLAATLYGDYGVIQVGGVVEIKIK